MKNKLFKGALVAIALSFSAVSFAGVITDVVEVDEKLSTSLWNAAHGNFDSLSFQHDINDNDFVLGSALSGNLSINIYDDGRDGLGGWKGEAAVIVVEGFDFDTGGLWGALLGSATPGWASELELTALVALNADGFLDVTIKSLAGDFWVGDSTLTVQTADAPTPVSEPGTLALLGLGLAGLGFTRRKAKA
ncbi:MAG: hypothetical protein ACI9T7_002521 [Oleiphilaceae bacterium]|jgi:hypothetical protein